MIWIKRVALLFCVFTVLAGVGFAFTSESSLFKVRSIPIEIVEDEERSLDGFRADSATVADLRQRLQKRMKKFERRKIWEIDIGQVSNLIRTDDWVRNVRISRSFPNRLEIAVSPRAPVFLLTSSKGKVVPVAADGALVETVNPKLLPDVPVLKGDRFFTDEALRMRAIEFARQLPAEGPVSLKKISEITWNANEGFSLSLLPSYTIVKLGEDRIALKVARVEQILDYMSSQELKGRVIDASFSKKVLVRLRKGP